MTTTSGFTFGHNLIDSGYPIIEAIKAVQPYVDEVVIVDMQSTDKTRETLEYMAVKGRYADKAKGGYYECPMRIIDGEWGNQAGETLRKAHSKYIECSGDIIIHFEADEVYDDRLLVRVKNLINEGLTDLAVYRLQLGLNFQRCRWYPELVHRVFPRLSQTRKEGHTTNRHDLSTAIKENGYLWDITNCFRDNWFNRVNKQAELRDSEPQYLMTPIHTLHKSDLSEAEAQRIIYGANYWEWKSTPFNIPEILRPLVGMVKYDPKV